MDAIHPSNATGTGTSHDMKTADKFGKMFALDRKRTIIWNPDSMQEATPANLLSHGTGTAALAEINSSEIAGLTLDADNESHSRLVWLPADLDTAEDIKFSVFWSNSEAAGTGSAQFVCKYTELIAGTTAIAVGATALSTAIADDVDLAANVGDWTAFGVLDGSTLSGTAGVDHLALKTYVDLTTAANATMYEIMMEYGRKYV